MGLVGDFADFQNGFAFKSKDFCEDGEYNVIKIKELKDGKIKFTSDTSKVKYVDGIEKYVVYNGDILFALTGDPVNKPNPLSWVGRVSLYKGDSNAVLNQRVCKVIPKEGLNPLYLYYFFRNDLEFYKLAGKATGSASQANISTKTISDTYIDLPKVEYQDRVVEILSSIDNKIEINERINDNLLQQAQLLYKDRFVDMTPFDRVMPNDWHEGTVSEIIELHDSQRIPLSSRERADLAKIYPYYGATSVMDYVDRYLFDGIYLLLGEDGTVVDAKGFPILQYVEGKFWVNNHAHIITGKNGFSVELLYLMFSLTNVQSIVTGAVQPKISQVNLNKVPVVIPSTTELQSFDSVIQPIFAQIRNLRAENDRLATIRDTLLPKLMSGELDVSNIDI